MAVEELMLLVLLSGKAVDLVMDLELRSVAGLWILPPAHPYPVFTCMLTLQPLPPGTEWLWASFPLGVMSFNWEAHSGESECLNSCGTKGSSSLATTTLERILSPLY